MITLLWVLVAQAAVAVGIPSAVLVAGLVANELITTPAPAPTPPVVEAEKADQVGKL